jgi:hypothetical protein
MGGVTGGQEEEVVFDPYAEIEKVKNKIETYYKRDRERSLVVTKLDEASLWLQRCVPVEPRADMD